MYAVFHCLDSALPDLGAFFHGDARLVDERQIYAISLLRGQEYPIEHSDLDLALDFPSRDWVDVSEADSARVLELARKGVLVTDSEDEELVALKARDETLAASGWNFYGALHYLLTKWSGVDLRASADEGEFPPITEQTIADFVALRGPRSEERRVGKEGRL